MQRNMVKYNLIGIQASDGSWKQN